MTARPYSLDPMRTTLLLSALLYFVAGALLLGQEASVQGQAGGSNVFVISILALVLGIIIIVLLVAD